jgi:D-alanyl-D-alanine carboxypeptidase (penicillin-binding protein 5/6)
MVAPFQLDTLQAEADALAQAAPPAAVVESPDVAPLSRRERRGRRRESAPRTKVLARSAIDTGPIPSLPVAPSPISSHSTGPVSRRERRLEATGTTKVRRRVGWRVAALAVVVLVVVAGTFTGIRLSAAAPKATVTSTLRPTSPVSAPAPSLPWSPTGESAIAVPSIGINVTSGTEQPVPIASLTKMMTAYVVLHDHPLAKDADGPNITITQADVDDYNTDTVSDEANAQVTVGEVLTQRQMMGGMLVHSANNLADALAMWDAGTIPAFVDKMNLAALHLGMNHTHYADPSGFNMNSQSTAGDLLKVAVPDMADPTFASLVQMSSITLPVAGTISTYTPLLGIQGVIGVKSGFTDLAGGCDVLAVVRRAHGVPVLVLSAVTGQQGLNVINEAGLLALNLANSVGMAIDASPVIHRGDVVAHVSAAGHTVDAVAQGSASVLTWPGVTPTRVLMPSKPVVAGAGRGTRIGSVVVNLGTQRVVIPVRLDQDIPKQTLTQRLF